jgi:hypothetical protein
MPCGALLGATTVGRRCGARVPIWWLFTIIDAVNTRKAFRRN